MRPASHPRCALDDLAVGTEHAAVVVENLSRTQIVQYAAASGDFNPIHHDELFATQAAGYPSVFAHGMLTMGLTGRMLTDWLGNGVLLDFALRFVRQVWPGDTLTAKGTVRALEPGETEGSVEIELVTSNQRGEPVATGHASAVLPRRAAATEPA
jgi:acyl dehydratase